MPFARSIANMLIFFITDAPSVRLPCNQHGKRDAVGWGHPPHQFIPVTKTMR